VNPSSLTLLRPRSCRFTCSGQGQASLQVIAYMKVTSKRKEGRKEGRKEVASRAGQVRGGDGKSTLHCNGASRI